MASFFRDTNGTTLRHQWAEIVGANINSATDAASAVLFATLKNETRFAYFDNTINVPIQLYLLHPSRAGDADTTYRLPWIKIPTNRIINYDFLQQIQVTLDVGTQIYISKAAGAGAATSGELLLSCYG